jgi:hypothetical protein
MRQPSLGHSPNHRVLLLGERTEPLIGPRLDVTTIDPARSRSV